MSKTAYGGKKRFKLVTLPFHGFERSKGTKGETTKSVEQQIRQTRIEEGNVAVQRSTPDERARIIKRFEEMAYETPMREELYQQAVEKAIKKGFGPSYKEDHVGDVDARFARDLEMATKLSLEGDAPSGE